MSPRRWINQNTLSLFDQKIHIPQPIATSLEDQQVLNNPPFHARTTNQLPSEHPGYSNSHAKQHNPPITCISAGNLSPRLRFCMEPARLLLSHRTGPGRWRVMCITGLRSFITSWCGRHMHDVKKCIAYQSPKIRRSARTGHAVRRSV
jgi:hypothetical protein